MTIAEAHTVTVEADDPDEAFHKAVHKVFGDDAHGKTIAVVEAAVMVESGTRVRVKDGHGKEDLGLGTYLGEADVVVAQTLDGSILTSDDPEHKAPHLADLPAGSQIVHVKNNPKIRLDDGRIVYGCQVWWEAVI